MSLTTRLEHSGSAGPSTLVSDLAPGTATISVTDLTGWPTGAVGPFVVTIARGTAEEERILCDTRTGNTLNVNASGRGWDGTVARSHSTGATIEHTWSTTEADQANAHSSAAAGQHGVTGNAVGDTDTQTLTNKTLTNPIINSAAFSGTLTGNPTFSGNPVFSNRPNIADLTSMQHDHSVASKGGNVPQASITGLVAALAALQAISGKGAANGYAGLDAGALVPFTQLPTGTGAAQVAIGNHAHTPGLLLGGPGISSSPSFGSGIQTICSLAVTPVAGASYLIFGSYGGFNTSGNPVRFRTTLNASVNPGEVTQVNMNQKCDSTGASSAQSQVGLWVPSTNAANTITAKAEYLTGTDTLVVSGTNSLYIIRVA